MKLFKNEVGRPSNKIKKKRKIFITSVVIGIAALFLGCCILFFGNFEGLIGTVKKTNNSFDVTCPKTAYVNEIFWCFTSDENVNIEVKSNYLAKGINNKFKTTKMDKKKKISVTAPSTITVVATKGNDIKTKTIKIVNYDSIKEPSVLDLYCPKEVHINEEFICYTSVTGATITLSKTNLKSIYLNSYYGTSYTTIKSSHWKSAVYIKSGVATVTITKGEQSKKVEVKITDSTAKKVTTTKKKTTKKITTTKKKTTKKITTTKKNKTTKNIVKNGKNILVQKPNYKSDETKKDAYVNNDCKLEVFVYLKNKTKKPIYIKSAKITETNNTTSSKYLYSNINYSNTITSSANKTINYKFDLKKIPNDAKSIDLVTYFSNNKVSYYKIDNVKLSDEARKKIKQCKSNTYNKTAIFYGDSITEGSALRMIGSSEVRKSWAYFLGKNYDLKQTINCGKGGWRISNKKNSDGIINSITTIVNGNPDPSGNIKCYLTSKTKDRESKELSTYNNNFTPDFVILSGGANDIGADIIENKNDTCYNVEKTKTEPEGCDFEKEVEKYLNTVLKKWPKSKIGYIITYKTPNNASRKNDKSAKYYEILKKKLKEKNISYIDLFNSKYYVSGKEMYMYDKNKQKVNIDKLLDVNKKTYLFDNLHINVEGYKKINDLIYAWMQKL